MTLASEITKIAKANLPTTAAFNRGRALALIEDLVQVEFSKSEAEMRAGAEPRLWKKYGKELLESGTLDGMLNDQAIANILKTKKADTISCLGAMHFKVKEADKVSDLTGDRAYRNALKIYHALRALQGEVEEVQFANLGLRTFMTGVRIGRVRKAYIDRMDDIDKEWGKLA